MTSKGAPAVMDRRQFMLTAALGVAAMQMGGSLMSQAAQAAQAIVLPKLPYADNALEPVISARTLGFHHGKHHAAYVANVNKLIAGGPLAGLPLTEIIRKTAGDPAQAGTFNNAAQVWNHTFYWHSMKPGGGGQPTGDLAARIKADLGGYDKFTEAFAAAAAGQFGSGWAWLVVKDGRLAVLKTPNAETPLAMGLTPLITIDVWEHAYYLDYQNRRPDYIKSWLDKLVNWEFAAQNLKM